MLGDVDRDRTRQECINRRGGRRLARSDGCENGILQEHHANANPPRTQRRGESKRALRLLRVRRTRNQDQGLEH